MLKMQNLLIFNTLCKHLEKPKYQEYTLPVDVIFMHPVFTGVLSFHKTQRSHSGNENKNYITLLQLTAIIDIFNYKYHRE